jgi:hypothetical protein
MDISRRSFLTAGGVQTLSRTLHEEVVYDRDGVTTVDWGSYPILTFPEVPALEFELIQRLDEPPLGVGEAASTPGPRGARQRRLRRDRCATADRAVPRRSSEGGAGAGLIERLSRPRRVSPS